MNKDDKFELRWLIFGLILTATFLGELYYGSIKLEEKKINLGSKLCNVINKSMTDLPNDLTAIECDYEVYHLTIDYEYDKWGKPTDTRMYCISERSSQIKYCYAE